MNSYLVHPPGEGSTRQNANTVLVADPFKLGPARLTIVRNHAHSNLVADDFDRLFTVQLFWKLAVYPTQVSFAHLPAANQRLHLPGLVRGFGEDENTGGEPVQAVHCV